MSNIVYLQCDARFNSWMLEKIDNYSVLEYTIEHCRKIADSKIIAGVYDCTENQALIQVLRNHRVEVYISNENNVNKRFLELVTQDELEAEFVIRVGGDQCLLDADKVNDVIHEMAETSMDFFYESYISCVLPDVVSVACLKKWESELQEGTRYFNVLKEKTDIKRYNLKCPDVISFNFRADSNEGLRICKHVIIHQLNPYELSRKMQGELVTGRYLVKNGLIGSWILPQEFFYDEEKEVNPWWTVSASWLVKKRLNKSMSVFEWGAGNSTLFFSQYVGKVVSIEHNREWYEKMQGMDIPNAEIKYVALEYGGEYCNAILEEKDSFDVISIDGRDRVRCAKNAVKRLKDNGVIIWDNADRKEYQEGYSYLEHIGFKKLELVGPTYGSPALENCTTIFYREENVLGI